MEDILSYKLKNEDLSKDVMEKKIIQSCHEGRKDVVDFFLSRGARVDCRDEEERTPLFLTSMYGYENIVSLILDHGVYNIGEDVFKALMKACKNGHYKVIEVLIERCIDIKRKSKNARRFKEIALMVACLYGHEKVVELLTEHDVNVDGSFEDFLDCKGMLKWLSEMDEKIIWEGLAKGETALMFACRGGNNNNKIVSLLIESGANVNAKNLSHYTALMFASTEGHEKIVKILIEHGANVNININDNTSMTSLMLACLRGHEEVVKILIEHGSNVNQMYRDGQTALWQTLESWNHNNFNIMETLIAAGADVNIANNDNATILMGACMNGQERMIKLLLKHNARVDVQDKKEGNSAVMNAVRSREVKALQALLPAEPNLDLINNVGQTVFSFVMSCGNTEFLKILLEEGKLLNKGRLKQVHRKAEIKFVSLELLLAAIKADIFEWEWCPVHFYKPVSLAALESGLSPGKMKYCEFYRKTFSPLVYSIVRDDSELTEMFLKRLYYFPEDYRTLCTDEDIRIRLINYKHTDMLDKITLQPLSLQTWSFLTVSKCITTSCLPGLRCQYVDALPIPDLLKRVLLFKSEKNI